MKRKQFLFITLGFNLYWFLAVWGQESFLWVLVLMLVACWWVLRDCWPFVAIVAPIGILMDTLLNYFGVFQFTENQLPLWLILLWFGFISFAWALRTVIQIYPPYVIITIGSIGGAASYWAGLRLQAVAWPLGVPETLGILVAAWLLFSSILLMVLKYSSTRWEG